MEFSRSRDLEGATAFDRYMALALSVRDRLVQRWAKTQRSYYEKDVKRAYYLSAEFLMGPHLGNNLLNLGITEEVRQAAQEAPEAIEQQKIPKAARDLAKGYFKGLGGQDEKPPVAAPQEK